MLLSPLYLLKADESLKNINLVDFVQLVSTNNNINIFVDEDLKKENVSLFVPDIMDEQNLFFMFQNSMQKMGYSVSQYNDIYYLTKNEKKPFTYFIKLKYNSFDNVSQYLKFKKIEYQFIDTTNTFVIYILSDNFIELQNDIKKIDAQKKQVSLKFTIIEFNEDLITEKGFQNSTTYQQANESYKNVLNTFVLPFQSTNPVFMRSTFYSALKLLDEQNYLNIKQNPYILVQDSKEFKFQAVKTIPFQTSTVTTQAANYSNQTSISYKDVGLVISGKALIYEDSINLDVDLIIEDLLSADSSTPTTYKRQLKSNTNLKYGEILLLSGIKQTKQDKNEFSIPFVSNIPYLGELFKYKYESNNKNNISIAIEVVNDNL